MFRFFILKIIRLISLFPSTFKVKFLNNFIKELNDNDSTFYYTFNYRNKFFKGNKNKVKFNTAIIIQGPILRKNNFTLNTINLYIKQCNSNIILSTWKDNLSQKEILNLKKKGIKIIINEPPKFAGPGNINFQLKTTSEALKLSSNLGNKFCIKTRTDCRIYLNNFDENLLRFHTFNLKKKPSIKIGSTSLTLSKRLFGISDIFMFGATKDLLSYFPKCYDQKEFDKFRNFLNNLKKKDKRFLQDSYKCIPENFLCYNYIIKNINRKINYNPKDYYKCLKNYFLIIDNSTLDFFWYKYNHQFEFRDKEYDNNDLYSNLSYLKWLKINF